MRKTLPRIYAGARRGLLWRLVANGLAQAGTLLFAALLLRGSVAPSQPSLLALLCLAASGSIVVVLRVHASGVAERLGQDYVTRVRLRIFEASIAQPVRAERGSRTGTAMTSVITDLSSLRNWVSDGAARSIVALVTLSGSTAAIAWLDVRAGLVLAAFALAGTCLALALVPVLRGQVREVRRRRGRLANNLGERLLAPHTVRLFGRTKVELRRVRVHSEWLRDALVRRARTEEALHALPDFLTPAATVLWIVLAGETEAPEIAAGILILGVLGTSLRDLTRAIGHRLAFEEGRRRIAALLAAPRLGEERDAQPLEGEAPVRLEFADVSIAGTLSGVTACAAAGQKVLVTGCDAQGRSTLLALAARLLDPDAGQVLIDGISLRRLTVDSLRSVVQLVSAELPLLRGTVAENIMLGAKQADPSWLAQVADACALSRQPALDVGLESRVEERGSNLSTSVRARVALARALATAPRLLLVDDPAFASDERAGDALRRCCALSRATTLVVGPEDSAMLPFDACWVVGDGGVELRRPRAPIPSPVHLAG